MALLAKGTWAVVMDEERAIILENTGTVDRPHMQEVERIAAEPLARYSDRPGRVHESTGDQRSAMEMPDLDRIAGARLAAHVVTHLKKVAGDRPVLIAAAPQVLGAVRAELNRQDALAGHGKLNLLGTIPKTLTGMPASKLPPILHAALDEV
jgi:protein required for attachment to host cells